MTVTIRLDALLRAAAERFGQGEPPIAGSLAEGLLRAMGKAPALPPAAIRTTDLIEQVIAPARDPVLAALANCTRDLHWKAPGFGNLPTSISDRMAVAELVGPNGTIHDEGIRFGFLWQGAGLLYPSHRHAAEELYLILSGAADWSVDEAGWEPQCAGSFIHHSAWQPHAIRTAAQPMLTAWGWAGDIRSASYSL